MADLKLPPTQGYSESQSPDEVLRALWIVASPCAEAQGKVVALNENGVAIGRDPSQCAIVLDDGRCSRRHAVVEPGPSANTWRVTDQASRNGVRVNGTPVQQLVLEPGDVLRVGDTLMVFAEPAEEPDETEHRSELKGRSMAMQRLRDRIQRVAARADNVLILGATGTGKELVARALHGHSQRPGPLVPINCGSIPRELTEATFFGRVRGGFTGATAGKGAFVEANGGTLFLDELGELPYESQASLLRVLESREVRPVGADHTIPVDVRIVAATLVALEQAMEDRRFRSDLYERFNQVRIDVPPLSERREDILDLARRFAPDVQYRTSALEAMLVYPWPRNVRELMNAVRNLSHDVAAGQKVRVEDLPAALDEHYAFRRTGSAAPAETDVVEAPAGPMTEQDVRAALERMRGNVTRAAKVLNVSRATLNRRLSEFKIDPESYRTDG